MSAPNGYCMAGEPDCEQSSKPEVMTNSLNAAGETFIRHFASSFGTQDLDGINSTILSVVMVLLSLLLFYVLLKFTTYYISLGFLSLVTLLHYWFGSKWCLDMMLARLNNLYTLVVISASYPKVSAVFVLGIIALSIWLSLRSYWLKKQREKRVESEKLKEGERMKRIEDKLDNALRLLETINT